MGDTTVSAYDRAIRALQSIQEGAYFRGSACAARDAEDALEAVEEMGQTLDSLRTWMLQNTHMMMACMEYLATIDKTKGR